MKGRLSWLFPVLTLLLFTSILCALCVGAVNIPLKDIIASISGFPSTHSYSPNVSVEAAQAIVWDVRAPRVLLAATVGSALAIAGAVLQAIVRNPLADPYILGVHSGASAGAALAIVAGSIGILSPLITPLFTYLGDFALQVAAFIGAITAMLLVFAIARGPRKSSGITATRLILAGVAVGYALSSTTSFLVFASDSAESSRSVMFWLLGSLALASWGIPLWICVSVVISTLLLVTALAPRIDALAAGDDTALSVGVDPGRLRALLLLLMCLLTGAVVAMSGAIAFLGLVVPHFSRRLTGSTHRRSIPCAALLGAILLIWADIASRSVLAPQEIPVGVVTALLGAPLLLFLIRGSEAS